MTERDILIGVLVIELLFALFAPRWPVRLFRWPYTRNPMSRGAAISLVTILLLIAIIVP